MEQLFNKLERRFDGWGISLRYGNRSFTDDDPKEVLFRLRAILHSYDDIEFIIHTTNVVDAPDWDSPATGFNEDYTIKIHKGRVVIDDDADADDNDDVYEFLNGFLS